MVCDLCGQRKAKRACPALNRHICAVCCGTKRLVEINCPESCVYLSTARSHPPAVVQRQQEHDRAQLLPSLGGLSERQARLFLMCASLVARHRGEALQKLLDDDIALAAAALASTLETSVKGIVYEHRAASLPADRLLTELQGLVADVTKEGGSPLERDTAIALRRLESAAKESAHAVPGGATFQELLVRMMMPPGGPGAESSSASPPPSIIIP